jgi:hypothetical protein
MSSNFPTPKSASDQELSDREYAEQLGLPSGALTRYGRDPYRRTLGSAMDQLIENLQRDRQFSTVDFTEADPDDILKLPRIVWKLKSRTAGAGGQNRKNAYAIEEIPLENGRVLMKSRQPHSFEIAFEIYEAKSDSADDLRDALELWLFDNKALAAQAGIECFVFQSELEPSILASKTSQKVYRRVLYYTGVIQYIHSTVADRLQSIKVWHANKDAPLNTVQLTRQTGGNLSYDLFPVPGPLVLAAIHDKESPVSVDYLYGVDYTFIIDRPVYGANFFIQWLTKGKAPISGATYYATYYTPDNPHVSTTLITESDGEIPLIPGGRVRRARRAITPTILGQSVDLNDPQRNETIIFASDNPEDTVVPMSQTYLESLIRAESSLVAVVDPQAMT